MYEADGKDALDLWKKEYKPYGADFSGSKPTKACLLYTSIARIFLARAPQRPRLFTRNSDRTGIIPVLRAITST